MSDQTTRPNDYDLRVRECEAAERQADAMEKIFSTLVNIEWEIEQARVNPR